MITSRIAAATLAAVALAAPADAAPHDDALGTVTSSAAAFLPPHLLAGVEPSFPEDARARVDGTIDLDLAVGTSGRVEEVTILRGLGAELDAAAVRAAEALVFAPARYAGEPVRCTVRWHFHVAPAPAATDPARAALDPDRAPAPGALAAEEAPHTATSTRASALTAEPSAAATAEAPAPYAITVRGRASSFAASSFTLRPRDFLLRPHTRPADVLGAAPGLYVVQHAGGGKANQYFLRGFDADHGTDLAFAVDGVPMNLPSHGHGQGYTDLNGLIPETIERIEVRKGPYDAEQGDFATAGSVDIVTRRDVPATSFTVGGGAFDTLRSLFLASPEAAGVRSLVAAEVYTTNGPFAHGEDLRRYSALGRVTRELSAQSRVSLAVTSYGAGWDASGQLPLREVRAGRLDRFGSLDPSEGGASARHSAQASWSWQSDDGDQLEVMGYLVHGRFQLFSNFTFFSADPVRGDMIEQGDVRTLGGLKATYSSQAHLGDVELSTRAGLQVRTDSIANALDHAHERARLSTTVDAAVLETTAGAFVREDVAWTPWLRTIFGLRADGLGVRVEDHLAASPHPATASAALLSPKVSLVATPLGGTSLYANAGYGFHSNDARGVVLTGTPVTPLVRALGLELGARTKLFDRVELAASVFRTDLDGELVWVGDAGTTEARGPTRRLGVEGELRVRVLDWLWADGDLTLADSTFVDLPSGSNAVPLAPRLVASAGVSVEHPAGWYGRLGALHLSDRPATEDRFLTAAGFTRVDLTAGYKGERFEVGLTVQNLLDTTWSEAQFANVSRLPGETSAAACPSGTRPAVEDGRFAGCEDLHFTPGAPLNATASATLYF